MILYLVSIRNLSRHYFNLEFFHSWSAKKFSTFISSLGIWGHSWDYQSLIINRHFTTSLSPQNCIKCLENSLNEAFLSLRPLQHSRKMFICPHFVNIWNELKEKKLWESEPRILDWCKQWFEIKLLKLINYWVSLLLEISQIHFYAIILYIYSIKIEYPCLISIFELWEHNMKLVAKEEKLKY